MKTMCFTVAVLAMTCIALNLGFAGDHPHAIAYEKCAKACSDCQRMCELCTTHCAKQVAAGKKEHLKTLQTCQDCAAHCSAAASIVARQGPFS